MYPYSVSTHGIDSLRSNGSEQACMDAYCSGVWIPWVHLARSDYTVPMSNRTPPTASTRTEAASRTSFITRGSPSV